MYLKERPEEKCELSAGATNATQNCLLFSSGFSFQLESSADCALKLMPPSEC